MTGIVLTFPIVTGKVEAWRRFCQELSGSRLQTYITSRRRFGITYERLALAETPQGPAAVTTLEAADIGRAISQMAESELAFDRWYRERLQELHGVTLAGYERFALPAPPPPDQELLFEWALSVSFASDRRRA